MKKLLSMLLAAIIMMTCLPLTAFADDTVMGDNTKRYTVLLLNVADKVNFLNENEEIIYTADSAIEYVKQSAIKFLTDLVSAAGENHVAVIAYAEEARIVSNFTTSISSVRSKVNELAPEHWLSNVDAALRKADSLLDDVTEEDAVKNIILVTTGMVNAGSYNYEGQYNENTTGSGWERMDTGVRLYAYANSALATAEPIKGK